MGFLNPLLRSFVLQFYGAATGETRHLLCNIGLNHRQNDALWHQNMLFEEKLHRSDKNILVKTRPQYLPPKKSHLRTPISFFISV